MLASPRKPDEARRSQKPMIGPSPIFPRFFPSLSHSVPIPVDLVAKLSSSGYHLDLARHVHSAPSAVCAKLRASFAAPSFRDTSVSVTPKQTDLCSMGYLWPEATMKPLSLYGFFFFQNWVSVAHSMSSFMIFFIFLSASQLLAHLCFLLWLIFFLF